MTTQGTQTPDYQQVAAADVPGDGSGVIQLIYERDGLSAEDRPRIATLRLRGTPDGRTVILTEHHSDEHPHPAIGDRSAMAVEYEITTDELVRLIMAHGSEVPREP